MPIRPPVHRPAYLPSPEQARKQYDTWRGSPSRRGYGRDWQKVRAAVLAEEPLCRVCLAQGRVTETTEVHHELPICDRPDLRLVRSNLQGLCKPHHSATTSRERAARAASPRSR